MWASGAYGYFSDYLLWYVLLGSLLIHAWCFFRFFSRVRRRMRLVFGNALVLLCLLAFVGLVGETYFRFVSVETDANGTSLTAKRWHKAYAQLNSQFFRDKEWTVDKPAEMHRIAFVGDSFVYGWGINDSADRFGDILQRRFAERGDSEVEVLNFGWSDWDTRDEFRGLRDVIGDYHPDEVVLCYLANDIEKLFARPDPNRENTTFLIDTQSSFLLDWMFHGVIAHRSHAAAAYYDAVYRAHFDPQIWARQAEALQRIIDWCAERGVRLRVAILPLIKTPGVEYDATRLHAKVTAFFREQGIAVVDLLGSIGGRDPDTLVVNARDPHPNETANRLFADAIWDAFWK